MEEDLLREVYVEDIVDLINKNFKINNSDIYETFIRCNEEFAKNSFIYNYKTDQYLLVSIALTHVFYTLEKEILPGNFDKLMNFKNYLIRAVINSYETYGRHYHNVSHINTMLNALYLYSKDNELSDYDLACLELAVIFHDVVYHIDYVNHKPFISNEKLSSNVFSNLVFNVFSLLEIDHINNTNLKDLVSTVSALIYDTRLAFANEETFFPVLNSKEYRNLLDILIDCDLVGFADLSSKFEQNNKDVIKELYQTEIPDYNFWYSRIKFFESLINKDIYRTQFFKTLLTRKAISNIKNEIDEISRNYLMLPAMVKDLDISIRLDSTYKKVIDNTFKDQAAREKELEFLESIISKTSDINTLRKWCHTLSYSKGFYDTEEIKSIDDSNNKNVLQMCMNAVKSIAYIVEELRKPVVDKVSYEINFQALTLDLVLLNQYVNDSIENNVPINKSFGKRNISEMLMLTVCELVEANDELTDDGKNIEPGKFEDFSTEVADTIIRLMDLSGYLEIDIASFIINKNLKNLKRPYKHGKTR